MPPVINEVLMEAFEGLLTRFGPQHWWPARSRLEVVVGAVLTQNTNWTNVEKAIRNLSAQDLLDAHRLDKIAQEDLAEVIRPAGYYRVKAQRLKQVMAWLCRAYDGDLNRMTDLPTDVLRDQLLAIKGVGPETADSILLYALDRPVFVVDAYTARVVGRHGWLEPPFDYPTLQDLFHRHLKKDVPLFNEYHALLVRVGKLYCRPRPQCDECPLNALAHHPIPS